MSVANYFAPTSLEVDYLKIIKDKNGNKLFKLPQNITLDIIPLDLWNDIAKYKYPFYFVVSEYPNQIPEFRNIKKEEFESIKPYFLNYYHENNGIPNIFNIQNKSGNGWFTYLTIDGHYMKSESIYITCDIQEQKIIFPVSIDETKLRVVNHSIDLNVPVHQQT